MIFSPVSFTTLIYAYIIAAVRFNIRKEKKVVYHVYKR